MEIFSHPEVLSAIIGAFTAIITALIITPIINRQFLKYKLEQEYKYEQRKKIKNVLSKNKTDILFNGSELAHRLRSILKVEKSTGDDRIYWKMLNEGEFYNEYYLSSSIYRFILFFGGIKKLIKDLIFLDTTIASPRDLEFFKYAQVFPQIFCGSHLFLEAETTISEKNKNFDRFLRNEFDNFSNCVFLGENIMTYDEFLLKFKKNEFTQLELLKNFFGDINPNNSDRLNWDILQVFWFTLASFLNSYGYDFQEMTEERIRKVIQKGRKQRLQNGFEKLLKDNKLYEQHQIKKTLRIIHKTVSEVSMNNKM